MSICSGNPNALFQYPTSTCEKLLEMSHKQTGLSSSCFAKNTTIALLLVKNIQHMHSQEAYSGLGALSPPSLKHALFQG